MPNISGVEWDDTDFFDQKAVVGPWSCRMVAQGSQWVTTIEGPGGRWEGRYFCERRALRSVAAELRRRGFKP